LPKFQKHIQKVEEELKEMKAEFNTLHLNDVEANLTRKID